MKQLLTAWRGHNPQEAMRQSTALTTVYLLEMNRKFEAYMRQKVETLEARVAAQQARTAGIDPIPARPTEPAGIALELDPIAPPVEGEAPAEAAWPLDLSETAATNPAEPLRVAAETAPVAPVETPQDIPDYLALLGPEPRSAETAPRSGEPEIGVAQPVRRDHETEAEAFTPEADQAAAVPLSPAEPLVPEALEAEVVAWAEPGERGGFTSSTAEADLDSAWMAETEVELVSLLPQLGSPVELSPEPDPAEVDFETATELDLEVLTADDKPWTAPLNAGEKGDWT